MKFRIKGSLKTRSKKTHYIQKNRETYSRLLARNCTIQKMMELHLQILKTKLHSAKNFIVYTLHEMLKFSSRNKMMLDKIEIIFIHVYL